MLVSVVVLVGAYYDGAVGGPVLLTGVHGGPVLLTGVHGGPVLLTSDTDSGLIKP